MCLHYLDHFYTLCQYSQFGIPYITCHHSSHHPLGLHGTRGSFDSSPRSEFGMSSWVFFFVFLFFCLLLSSSSLLFLLLFSPFIPLCDVTFGVLGVQKFMCMCTYLPSVKHGIIFRFRFYYATGCMHSQHACAHRCSYFTHDRPNGYTHMSVIVRVLCVVCWIDYLSIIFIFIFIFSSVVAFFLLFFFFFLSRPLSGVACVCICLRWPPCNWSSHSNIFRLIQVVILHRQAMILPFALGTSHHNAVYTILANTKLTARNTTR